MSMRTIVEFNHDYGHEIERDPDGFLRALQAMINSGSSGRDVKNDLSRYGVTVTPTCHHSEDRRVVLGAHADVKL